jgi:CRISPR system Cascade subunit CasB
VAESKKNSGLVGYLTSLARDDNRASLAALRNSLRPGQELSALRFVVNLLPTQGKDGAPLSPQARRQQEDDAILVAGLFALHPESGSLSLARALSILRSDTGSDSIEGRFRALLSANRSDLAPHLRHAVSLLAGKGLAIDWDNLLRALRYWDHEEARSRREWARDFWTAGPAPSATAEPDISSTTTPPTAS